MKIGIIGSNGFIGSNVYNNLKKNSFYKVIKFSSYKKLKKDWIKKVSDEIKIFKPNIIINCAAYQDLTENKKSIKYHLNSNLFSNIFFLNQATNYSSFKGYINFGTKWEFDKKGNFQPLNFYAATKHACDNYLQYFSQKKNIVTISLKIFDTYGKNDKRKKFLNSLIKSYKNNKSLNVTHGNQYLDFVHIDDLTNLVFKICEDIKKKKLEGFNFFTVSSKQPIKLKFLVKKLQSSLKKNLKVKIGAKKYRVNESMQYVKKIKNYPGWKTKINFFPEIIKIFDN